MSAFDPEKVANDVPFNEIKENNEVKSDIIIRMDEKIEVEKSARLPRNGGKWLGEEGNSVWAPDRNIEPGDRNGTNPEQKVWNDILNEYNIEGIPFNDGESDFTEVSKGKVEINDFSGDRSLNFDQADEKLADIKGCDPEDVEQWRKENRYTWHECMDCKTMQKVPTEVHGNIPHSGGISEYKQHASIDKNV